MSVVVALVQLSEEAWKSVPALCVFGSLNLWLVLAFLKHLAAQANEEREARTAHEKATEDRLAHQAKACEDRIERMGGKTIEAMDRNTKALDRTAEVTESVRELLRRLGPPSPS